MTSVPAPLADPLPEPLPPGPISIGDAVTLALNYCNSGWLAMSDHVCARILDAVPGDPRALIVRGVTAYKGLDGRRAGLLLERAVALDPTHADACHHLGMARMAEGRRADAGAAFAWALALRPGFAEAMAGLAEVRKVMGDADGALDLLSRSVALRPNYSPSYVAHSLMRFDRTPTPEPPSYGRRPREAGRPRLTMASLASYGRLTHTIHEYVAVRLYAEKYGLTFETPDWIGHRFFTLDDPAMDPDVLPRYEDWKRARAAFACGFEETANDPLRDRDLFLGGSPVDPFRAEHRERILSWLAVRPCWERHLEPQTAFLRSLGDTVVALHIRQTDWWDRAYTPLRLYLSWLEETWPTLHRPVLAVSTDEPSILPAFAAYAPVTVDRFPLRWEGLEYLQDFHVLMTADIVAISTGNFARTAAALNPTARLFLRPDAGNVGLEPFDPWI